MSTRFLHRLVALTALAASLVLAPGAQALTITPRAAPLAVTLGGLATAEFDIDFGAAPLDLLGLQVDIDFPVTQLRADADAVTLSFAGAEPPFWLGEFIRANHAQGLSINWALGPVLVVPQIAGTAVLSMPLKDLGQATSSLLSTHVQLFTLDDTLDATAQLAVVASAVPEPQTALLALLGSFGLIALRRRPS